MNGIRILPRPSQGCRGRRARRAAFYHRQRLHRLMDRCLRPVNCEAVEQAILDLLIYGVGAIKIERVEPMPEIDPMTGEPWAHPFRVSSLSREEFEREFPARWPQE